MIIRARRDKAPAREMHTKKQSQAQASWQVSPRTTNTQFNRENRTCNENDCTKLKPAYTYNQCTIKMMLCRAPMLRTLRLSVALDLLCLRLCFLVNSFELTLQKTGYNAAMVACLSWLLVAAEITRNPGRCNWRVFPIQTGATNTKITLTIRK